ncbi:RidA family protein [Clostridium folliculivorans]|uniref:Reactive intermediate/imine deaminase n=1 Tax=Clostridium folliculivorans TaxID=2886038 RepID=A0A9W5XYJ1_9CLOT|nr:RidA family protein [Clostridium folliculivorans]GKU23409.1 reactive intermediate/imine deaminase [Clostridium folliculivorans]GKU29526.1 reactive intermediate/imine deaminase [Clostridium folliculivorans]
MKNIISTENAPKAIGPYSQGISIEKLVFTSGQIPLDPATGELITEIKAATKRSMLNVKAILEQAGSSLDNIIKATIFLKNIDDFNSVNEVYGEFFKENPPARSCVEVSRLPKDAVIEIEVIAFKNR